MSVHVMRRRRRAASPGHASCEAVVALVERITAFAVILLMAIIPVCGGGPVCGVVGLVMAVGAAAAQTGVWLSGQHAAADCPGSV
ncbi:hypothetical protein ABT269_35020 [Streptomyces viridosporus]|uniref:hypothetical protein n=1 Tax=Streptomyces viridosporus TaxID=67581 RepID=UPI00332DBA82